MSFIPEIETFEDTEGSQIYKSYLNKEINHEQYLTQNALLVAARHKTDYIPSRLAAPAPQIVNYAKDRVENRNQYNKDSSRMVGDWVSVYIKAMDKNNSDSITLLWAAKRLEANNMLTEAKDLQEKLKLYARQIPDFDFLKCALRARQLDEWSKNSSG